MCDTLLKACLAVSLLLGQTLCCCTAKAEAQVPVRQRATPAHAHDTDEAMGHSCCCHEAVRDGECPPSSSHSPHQCPCRGDHPQGTLSAIAKQDLGSNVLGFENLLSIAGNWTAHIAATSPADTAAIFQLSLDSVHPSARAILRALHMLRC